MAINHVANSTPKIQQQLIPAPNDSNNHHPINVHSKEKILAIPNKSAVHSLISKRTSIFGSKITKSSHEPHVAPMKRGHEHSRLANSFSSKGQNSTAACLDRSKHQSVRHMLDSHPPIPAIVLTGSKTHHGAKSMAE
ncbi:hypothetical protein V6N13_046213 [Hibiscus sabdariffa]